MLKLPVVSPSSFSIPCGKMKLCGRGGKVVCAVRTAKSTSHVPPWCITTLLHNHSTTTPPYCIMSCSPLTRATPFCGPQLPPPADPSCWPDCLLLLTLPSDPITLSCWPLLLTRLPYPADPGSLFLITLHPFKHALQPCRVVYYVSIIMSTESLSTDI